MKLRVALFLFAAALTTRTQAQFSIRKQLEGPDQQVHDVRHPQHGIISRDVKLDRVAIERVSTAHVEPERGVIEQASAAQPAKTPSCQCPVCQKAKAPAKPLQPWKPNLFANDFSYKNKPNAPTFFGECLKDMPFTICDEDFTFSTGGEVRHRYHDEQNRLRPPRAGDDTYQLWRWRHYAHLKGKHIRVYGEMIDASIFGEDLGATAIDLNRWDVLNAFVDLNMMSLGEKPVWLRVGRQELQYGAQRLISPLDFANTRRNFTGLRMFYSNDDWNLDAFATRPVNTATGHLPLARFDNERDEADYSRTFSGVYATYKGVKQHTFDLYWLWLREQDERARRARFPDGSRHTVGARWAGSAGDGWLWDAEGGYQFGHDEFTETVKAWFVAGQAGYHFKSLPWQPQLLAVYHYGSGDRNGADAENNTFTPLFPLGHAYWGVIDNLGGPNLVDYSVRAVLKPHKKASLIAAYHWFDLANNADVLYNIAQVPLGAPNTGSKIGEEIDLILNVNVNPNLGFQFQYAEFFNGTFIDNNLPRKDARQFFAQTTVRY